MPLATDISEPFRSVLEEEFRDEPILWASLTDPGRQFRSAAWTWLFSVPSTAGMGWLFWRPPLSDWSVGTWLFQIATGALFALALLFPFWAWRKAGRTVYALTATRLSIIQIGSDLEVHSIQVSDVGRIIRRERPDGSGTLSFAAGWAR